MSEQLRDTSPERGKLLEKFAEYEPAIKRFLQEQFPPAGSAEWANRPCWGFDFDMTDPEQDIIAVVRSKEFEIEPLAIYPRPDSEKLSFHFCIGRTEFHITGKAADRIHELMETKE